MHKFFDYICPLVRWGQLLTLNLNLTSMTEQLLYLTLPPYLAQWYADECRRNEHAREDTYKSEPYRYPTPVKPLRGSLESGILELFLTKQPAAVPEDFKDGANLVLAIPSFRNRDPRIYNYLRPSAREALQAAIHTRFQVKLFQDIHELVGVGKARKDLTIIAWMEQHAIDFTETNYNSILKVFDRMRNTYTQSENRKIKKESKKSKKS